MRDDEMPALPHDVATTEGELADQGDVDRIDGSIEELPPEMAYWFDFQERIAEQSLLAASRGAAVVVQVCGIFISMHIGLRALNPSSTTMWWVSLTAWVASLLLGFYGLVPTKWGYRRDNVLHLRATYRLMVARKVRLVRVAATLCVLGLLTALCGFTQ